MCSWGEGALKAHPRPFAHPVVVLWLEGKGDCVVTDMHDWDLKKDSCEALFRNLGVVLPKTTIPSVAQKLS